MRFHPLKAISNTLTAFIIFLSFPAVAILATWNSLPESFLYPVKIGLEKTALALLPNSFFESEFRLKLIDRRTAEATNVIIKSPADTKALQAILAEAHAAQDLTVQLDDQDRSQASQKLVQKLIQTSKKLDQVKHSVSQTTSSNTSPRQTYYPSSNYPQQTTYSQADDQIFTQTETSAPQEIQATPLAATNTVVSTNTSNDSQVIKPVTQTQETITTIEDTQAEITEIIEILEENTIQEGGNSGNISPGLIDNQNSNSQSFQDQDNSDDDSDDDSDSDKKDSKHNLKNYKNNSDHDKD